MTVQRQGKAAAEKPHHGEELEYRLLMVVAFMVFLPVAAVTRMMPRRWRPLNALGGERGSLLRATWETASIAVASAFMA